MSDTTKTEDALNAAVEAEFAEYQTQLSQMAEATEDPVVARLVIEIVERMALLARRFGIPYLPMFPIHCTGLVLSTWRANEPTFAAFISDDEARTGARAVLDALYAAPQSQPES